MSKRPETRYQTGDQFAVDLRKTLSQVLDSGAMGQPGRSLGGSGASERTVTFSATEAASPDEFQRTNVLNVADLGPSDSGNGSNPVK